MAGAAWGIRYHQSEPQSTFSCVSIHVLVVLECMTSTEQVPVSCNENGSSQKEGERGHGDMNMYLTIKFANGISPLHHIESSPWPHVPGIRQSCFGKQNLGAAVQCTATWDDERAEKHKGSAAACRLVLLWPAGIIRECLRLFASTNEWLGREADSTMPYNSKSVRPPIRHMW